jgi:Arc/MetJ family transcription regulator
MFDLDTDEAAADNGIGRALGNVLQALEREARALEARITATIAAAEHAVAFAEDGHSTVAGWCRAWTQWSTTETTARVRTARLGHREPTVTQSLTDGVLGVGYARELGRASANPRCGNQLGRVLPLLLEHARQLSFEEFRLVVRRWEMLADSDGTHRDRDTTRAARSASLIETADGFLLRASCNHASGAALKEIFDRFIDDEWHADWNTACAEHGNNAAPGNLPRTDPQRRFDALAAIFLRAATAPPDGQQPEPLVNLVIDTITLERLLHPNDAGDGGSGGQRPDDPRWWRSETTDGTPVPPDDVIAAMIWGRVRRVVIDTTDGTILDVGRRRRLFTGRARDAVLLASTRCTWPGCRRPSSRSQADHRTEHQHGGATDIGNGDACCAKHNRFKSRARITVSRDEHGYLHHWRPDGTEINHTFAEDP